MFDVIMPSSRLHKDALKVLKTIQTRDIQCNIGAPSRYHFCHGYLKNAFLLHFRRIFVAVNNVMDIEVGVTETVTSCKVTGTFVLFQPNLDFINGF